MAAEKSTKSLKKGKKEKKKRDKLAKSIADAINSNEEIKNKRESLKLKKEHMKDRETLEEIESFLRRPNSVVLADKEDYEGHYPGNQSNTVLIPYKSKIIHR
jgi:hypothetical protein